MSRSAARPALPRISAAVAGLALSLAASAEPSFADKKKDTAAAIAAAAALALGVAALASDQSDWPAKTKYTDSKSQSQFEMGYRDALYGAPYRTNMPASTYGAGYNAGAKERQQQQAGKGGVKFKDVPNKAMKSCVKMAADAWDVKRDRVWASDARKGTAQTWLIEVVSGQRQGICNMAADGTARGKFINGGSL